MSFKKHLLPWFLAAVLLAGCAAPGAPITATPAPTRTEVPRKVSTITPTPAPTLTPSPTLTPQPSATTSPRPSFTPTPAPTHPPTPTCDATLAPFQDSTTGSDVDGLGTARLLIINQSGEAQVEVIVKGVTLKRSQPAYYTATVTRSTVIEILWGSYSILAQVPGRGSLTAAYVQRGKDKTTLIVGKDRLTIIGP